MPQLCIISPIFGLFLGMRSRLRQREIRYKLELANIARKF